MVIQFITADGASIEVEGTAGQSIMEIALANNVVGIDAECGGCCTCCTCHAYVDDAWLEQLEGATEDEEMLLEFAWERAPNSRLTCQIPMQQELTGIVVRVPAEQA